MGEVYQYLFLVSRKKLRVFSLSPAQGLPFSRLREKVARNAPNEGRAVRRGGRFSKYCNRPSAARNRAAALIRPSGTFSHAGVGEGARRADEGRRAIARRKDGCRTC